MNYVKPVAPAPTPEDAAEALDVLRAWAAAADPVEVARLDPAISRLLPGGKVSNYPDLSRVYPEDFKPDAKYRASMLSMMWLSHQVSRLSYSSQAYRQYPAACTRLPR